ncbi:MAG: hypothetical protein K0Q89_3071 [Thermomicrobiales bacterium]|nr:hypothetical protein [Thermomicrobiales bacterium]
MAGAAPPEPTRAGPRRRRLGASPQFSGDRPRPAKPRHVAPSDGAFGRAVAGAEPASPGSRVRPRLSGATPRRPRPPARAPSSRTRAGRAQALSRPRRRPVLDARRDQRCRLAAAGGGRPGIARAADQRPASQPAPGGAGAADCQPRAVAGAHPSPSSATSRELGRSRARGAADGARRIPRAGRRRNRNATPGPLRNGGGSAAPAVLHLGDVGAF